MSDIKQAVPLPQMIGSLPLEVSPSYTVVYANMFRYRASFNDIALIFSTVSDPKGGVGPAIVTDGTQVIMSYGQAKSLMEYLQQIIHRFERDVGPIKTIGQAPPTDSELDAGMLNLISAGSH